MLVEAMSDLDDRFVLNLMLTGTAEGKASLSSMTQSLGSRVRFIEAVPMAEVSSAINDFDLEVIFYPPTGPNYLFSFPNKFFEAVQGRLGIVIGQSPSMVEVVTKYDNGVVVDGWESSDLARTLNSLTADRIRAMKNRSNICAETLNSQQEGVEFLKSIGADPH